MNQITEKTETEKKPSENDKQKSLSVCAEPSLQNNSHPEAQISGPQSPETTENPPPISELSEMEKRQMSKKIKQMEKLGMAPMPGFMWNPLRKLPPNRECPCLSGKKFKACCLDVLAPVVSIEIGKHFEAQMLKPDLVFMTADNKEKIEKRIAPAVKAEMEKVQKMAQDRMVLEKRRIDDATRKLK
jgi:hypothetical protein